MSLIKTILIGIISFVLLIFIIGSFLPKEKSMEQKIYLKASEDLLTEIFIHPENWKLWHDQLKDNDRVVLTPKGKGEGAVLMVEIPNEQRSKLTCESISNAHFRFSTLMGDKEGGIKAVSEFSWKEEGEQSFALVYKTTWELGSNPIHKMLSFMIEDYYQIEQERTLNNIKIYMNKMLSRAQ